MVQKTVPVCETQPHLHSTLPAVSGWLRLSMVVSFLLLAAINVLFMYGMLGRVDPAHLSYMQTPLMPQSWVYSIWILILFLQGLAVIDQALPSGYSDLWRAHIIRTIGLSWQLGWAAEASSQLALYSPTKIGLWAGLCSLTAATAAFAWTLSQMYGLRRRFLLGPPSFHAFCLYFASTDISTAWLSFSLADKLLVICKAYGAPQQTVDALAMVVIVAAWAGAMWVVSNKKSSYYGLAIIWILVGIYSRQTSQATRAMCLLLVFGLGLACIFSVMRKRGCGGGRDRGLRQMDVPSLPLTCDEHLERIEST